MSENNSNVANDAAMALFSQVFKDARRARRWSYFFRFLLIGYVVFVSAVVLSNRDASQKAAAAEVSHIGVVDLIGPIARDVSGVDAMRTVQGLEKAFANDKVAAVVLQMDSPGGSPAQSDLVYRELMRLKQTSDKPVIAVIGDICASGCYYIAAAADEILANRNSIIGNIGVKMESFGMTGLMDRFGVDRRIISSGDHKTLLDPFSPEDTKASAHIREHIIGETFDVFVDVVKTGRAGKIDESNPDLFSGLIWAGPSALNIGLIDGFGDVFSVARAHSPEAEYKNYTVRQITLSGLFEQMRGSLSVLFRTALSPSQLSM